MLFRNSLIGLLIFFNSLQIFSQEKDSLSEEIYTAAEEMPVFNGGEIEMAKFIKRSINYPRTAMENDKSGTVYVSFVVDTNGGVRDTKILRGVGYGLDEEAVRVVKLMDGKWNPGKQNGKKVKVQYSLPIKFSLVTPPGIKYSDLTEIKTPINHYNNGVEKAKRGQYEEAIKDYNEAIKINPKDIDALYNRGVCKYSIGDKEGACDDWFTAYELGDNESKKLCEQKCYPLFGEDTLRYNEYSKRTFSRQNFYYYEIVKQHENDTSITVSSYYSSGQPRSIGDYSSRRRKISEGQHKSWYPNGQLKSQIDFTEGKYNGNVITYWDNGQLKRKDVYSNGEFKKGNCYDINGKEIEHFAFEVMPSFPGGLEAMMKFLRQNIKYPQIAMDKNIMGTVYVSFYVGTNGSINDVRVLRTPDKELAIEALRVVNQMPSWDPGVQDGEKVKVQYVLPVKFSLTSR